MEADMEAKYDYSQPSMGHQTQRELSRRGKVMKLPDPMSFEQSSAAPQKPPILEVLDSYMPFPLSSNLLLCLI